MLEVRGLTVAYGQHRALEDVRIQVATGEIAVILGANGAGKSTLLKAVAGLCEGSVGGSVEMEGTSLLGLAPHRIVEVGIALVPEGRGIFADLTVRENLLLGAHAERARADQAANLDRVMDLFPKLAERRKQVVRTMSGGEQQMVAIGRAMMSAPRILMLDEPSLGLSPLLCRDLFRNLAEVRQSDLGILLVEQNARQSLAIADRGYLLENGCIMAEDTAANLSGDTNVQAAYLGVSGDATAPPAPPDQGRFQAFPMEKIGQRAAAPRARTEDLIGADFDDLVRRAAAVQARPAVARPPAAPTDTAHRPSATAASGGSDRLREVLAEIERAAAAARLGGTGDAASGEEDG